MNETGPSRRFVVKTYVTATCAADALRKSRRVHPDDVYSLDSEKDGAPSGGSSAHAVGFVVEVGSSEGEAGRRDKPR